MAVFRNISNLVRENGLALITFGDNGSKWLRYVFFC